MRRTLARWAPVLFAVVVVLRLLLMIVQTHDRGRGRQQPADGGAPGQAIASGQVLRFDPGDPRLAVGPQEPGRALQVALLNQDGRFMDTDTACSLDPAAMSVAGGTLTLLERTPAGTWIADWLGGRTTAVRQSLSDPDPDPKMRAIQAALAYGVDCGGDARVELSAAEVTLLLDLLAGRPAPLDAQPPRLGLGMALPQTAASP